MGEVIEYIDGYAWGVVVKGDTICMGAEAVVKEAIANRKRCGITDIDQIISLERQLQIEEVMQNGRIPEVQRPGAFRSRIAGKAKRGASHIKPASFRKKLPGGSA